MLVISKFLSDSNKSMLYLLEYNQLFTLNFDISAYVRGLHPKKASDRGQNVKI